MFTYFCAYYYYFWCDLFAGLLSIKFVHCAYEHDVSELFFTVPFVRTVNTHPHSHLHPHTYIPTPTSSHLHPHTYILTPTSSHLHPHTYIPTPTSPHLHPHTYILTPTSPHLHPHTYIPTLAYLRAYLHPHTCIQDLVGRIIGKGGTSIKAIQDQSGAHIDIPRDTGAPIREITITGDPSQVGICTTLIQQKMAARY